MLERIGESATGATKGIFGDSGDSESDGDPAGSETPELVRETEEALRKVLRTLTRIFAEPFRTEDEHEMSAVVGGIGEGAIEFVLKPVPAMPHIASLTARGMANNPRTVYLNTDKFIKKESADNLAPYQFSIQKKNIMVHMDKDFNVEIDERALKREIIEAFKKQDNKFDNLIVESSARRTCSQSGGGTQEPLFKSLKSKTGDIPITLHKRNPNASAIPLPRGELQEKEFYHIDEFNNDESVLSDDSREYNDFVTVADMSVGSPRSVVSDEDLYEETHIACRPRATVNHALKNPLLPASEIFKSFEEQKGSNEVFVDVEEEKVVIEKVAKKVDLKADKVNEIVEKAKTQGYSKYKDEFRVPPADDVGGLPLVDKKVTELLRGVATEFIKQFFSRIIRGNFNLTTISFPIKCMRPVSILETFGLACVYNPVYLNKAALLNDPVEQCKYMIASQISTYHLTSGFLKPVCLRLPLAEPDTRGDVHGGVRGRDEVLRRADVAPPAHIALHASRARRYLRVHRIRQLRGPSRTQHHLHQRQRRQKNHLQKRHHLQLQ
eukprot:TRINITY_DN1592_c0_g1_i2.p1 TRINITY_DN1592_c0_g1~~TRINITY_DN1592_c0_g1_i2.p1  ORF type:complete len:552 (+),score=118.38 TRINITY_DN1592_c0_g1_i2:695-2350(+)